FRARTVGADDDDAADRTRLEATRTAQQQFELLCRTAQTWRDDGAGRTIALESDGATGARISRQQRRQRHDAHAAGLDLSRLAYAVPRLCRRVDADGRAGVADRVYESGGAVASARDGTTQGDCDSLVARRESCAIGATVID